MNNDLLDGRYICTICTQVYDFYRNKEGYLRHTRSKNIDRFCYCRIIASLASTNDSLVDAPNFVKIPDTKLTEKLYD